jgi:hypothetical protein
VGQITLLAQTSAVISFFQIFYEIMHSDFQSWTSNLYILSVPYLALYDSSGTE